jgi:mono/diheme cytochrome c family protein
MKTNRIVGILMLMLMFSGAAYADPIEEGKSIFMTRCAGCHNVNQRLTGPALAGVHERRSIEWIISFVKSSQTMVKSGDKDATAIFEQFNKIPMPDHSDLSDDNIKQIVEYIKSEAKPVDEENKAPFAKPHQKKSNARPLTAGDYGMFALYLFVVFSLIITLLLAVKVRNLKRERSKESLPV